MTITRDSSWSVYDLSTGLFTGKVIGVPDDQLAANIPPGCDAVLGIYNSLKNKVDLATKNVVYRQPGPPADTEMATFVQDPDTGAWLAQPTLKATRLAALNTIDLVAGAARLRYITDVPGQQGVYLQKAAEAEAFKAADFTGDVPPYIEAEATATGQTPQDSAEKILAIAQSWSNTISPAIERYRISGKAAVDAATDAAAVQDARNAAVTALQAI
ncbi:MAG: putative tail fiber assembly-like protein [Rhodoferax sp.]|nr:putative tail fiber assembly-like protein [Rhodoferax sp.]